MTFFQEGDKVRFPDPLKDGEIVDGTFHEVIVNEPMEVPTRDGGTRLTDACWVSRADDSTTARVPCDSIRPAVTD
jgi:hypothetical protein